MALTLEEIKDRLRRWDEITIVEELGLRTEDIIDRFTDVIEDKADYLETLVNWEEL
jgi:precorrin-2 methylase